jgi:hypothetical protein
MKMFWDDIDPIVCLIRADPRKSVARFSPAPRKLHDPKPSHNIYLM